MNANPYSSFDQYVLRTPLLPWSRLRDLTAADTIEATTLKGLFSQSAIVQEAIFLASPSLSERLDLWATNKIRDAKEEEGLSYAFLKYFSRMCSRSTPFGLFAGIAVGSLGETTQIALKEAEQFKRHTRFDMNYLIALSQDLARQPHIMRQLKFYPNSSLYRIGREWRYIEYHYNRHNRRVHQTISLDEADYLEFILDSAQKGAYLSELARLLVNDEVTGEEASAFVIELVQSQVLVSELEPSVSGSEFATQLMTCLKNLQGIDSTIQKLEEAHNRLHHLDKVLGNESSDYLEIADQLKPLGTSFDLKHLFQTDMVLSNSTNQLSTSIRDRVLKALSLMNKMTGPRQETLMQQFGQALYERYESREVPLTQALDVEVGIGFKQNQGGGDINYFIDDIAIPANRQSAAATLKLTPAMQILHEKLMEMIRQGQKVIQLKDSDFEKLPHDWSDLPDTMSTMLEVINEKGEEKVLITGFGGSSAANLLGRFCHADDALYEHTQNIIDKEFEMNHEIILAEIVHLPESRVGNILMRPSFRPFEIPYLAKSMLPVANQVQLDDLVVSALPNGTVRLRSISRNKQVQPRLTNAHNYVSRSLPIYHFLSDLQSQSKRMPGFTWGSLTQMYKRLPRVEYERVILSKAQWTITKNDINDMLNARKDDTMLKEAIAAWKDASDLPDYVLLVESDNELMINTCNLTAMRMMLDEVKKMDRFMLSEFLHEGDGLVKHQGECYCNQVVMSFYNREKLKNAHS